ncbi:MAG: tetratricopeptide repeat protein [Candidatus Brocadiia bacterium]
MSLYAAIFLVGWLSGVVALHGAEDDQTPSPLRTVIQAMSEKVSPLDRRSNIAVIVPDDASTIERYSGGMLRFWLQERNNQSVGPLARNVEREGSTGKCPVIGAEALKARGLHEAVVLWVESVKDAPSRLKATVCRLPDRRIVRFVEEPFLLPDALSFLDTAKPLEISSADQRWLELLRKLFPECGLSEGEKKWELAEARVLFRLQLWKAAAARYDKFLSEKPDMFFLKWVVASQLAGNGKEARQRLERVLQLQPDSGPLYALKSWLILSEGSPKDALLFVEQARLSDVAREGYYWIARYLVALEQKNAKASRQALQKAVETLPKSPFVLEKVARDYWNRAELKDAIGYYERALRFGAKGKKVLIEYAMALDASDRTKEALEVFRKAFRDNPGDAALARHLSATLKEAGRYEEAVSVLQKATQTRPDLPELRMTYAEMAASMWETEKALKAYRRAEKIGDGFARAAVGYAQILMRKREFKRAASGLRKTLKTHPGYEPARLALAEAMIGQGLFEEAESVLKKALEQADKEVPVRIALANFYRLTGEHKKSVHNAQVAVIAQESPEAYAALARSFIVSEAWDNAEITIKKALETFPGSSLVYIVASELALGQKKFEGALGLAQKVLQKRPHSPPALKLAGEIALEMERPEECVKYWLKAVELDRWDAWLEWRLAEILHRELQQKERATIHYARHAELNGEHAKKAAELVRKLSPDKN